MGGHCAKPNTDSSVRFNCDKAGIGVQSVCQSLQVGLAWEFQVQFPLPDQPTCNAYRLSQLAARKPLFKAFCQDMVAKCL